MKRLLLFIGNILLFASAQGQQVLNLLTGELMEGEYPAKPIEKVAPIENGYLVTYTFTEALLKKDPYFTNCILWEYTGYMVSNKNGSPAFPYQNGFLDIDNSTPTITIVDSSYVDFNYQLAPAYPAQPISNPYSEVVRLPISPYSGFLPISAIKTIGCRRNSGRREVLYTVYPIQYNYEQQIIRAYTKIVYKVTLSDSTTGIEELKTKEDMPTNSFTLDGRPVKGNAKSVIIQDGKKLIIK